jgi:hypothetical protein
LVYTLILHYHTDVTTNIISIIINGGTAPVRLLTLILSIISADVYHLRLCIYQHRFQYFKIILLYGTYYDSMDIIGLMKQYNANITLRQYFMSNDPEI